MDFLSLDPTLGASVVNLGNSLASLALKGTATAVHGKIESLKNEKNVETVRNTYDDVINQLLSEREEAVRIAQAYKAELEQVVISDEDIAHLHTTISNVLDLVHVLSPEAPTSSFDWIKNLASADTLKTMQLLGFNYKEAIGAPLTKICSEFILEWGKQASKQKNVNNSTHTNNGSKRK